MKVLIAGPRALSKLNDDVKNRINTITDKQHEIFVGDANGIDKAVQKFLFENKYTNVSVYASNGKARNNIGNWPVVNVDVDSKVKGFDFYVAKDIKMIEDADHGFIIWNGESKGSLNNIINLVNKNKKVLLYYTPDKNFYTIDNIDMVEKIACKTNDITKAIFHELYRKLYSNNNEQLAMFS